MNKKIFNFIKKLWHAILIALGFTACGVTKATITKPAEGTSTTITITTNNPMTTNVSPDVQLKNTK